MIRLAFALLGVVALSGANAEPLPTTPILHIDTGRHGAFIHALVLDENSGRFYSASEDKTVRAWRIADGRPLDTFRLPAGERAEGQAYALALSPDGGTLAVGGWTCWDAEGTACVYLLDAQTGEVRKRIRGLSDVIATIKYSPDGRHLAVGLMAQGLRVFRASDGAQEAEDRAYRDKLLELDFSPAPGKSALVATSLDGYVRLYDPSFKLLGRIDADLAGKQPFGVRYSPDGRYVALGFNDLAKANVLRATDLAVVKTLEVRSEDAPANLTRVAWSPDSSVVYVAGEPKAGRNTNLIRWSFLKDEAPRQFMASRGRIGDLAITRAGDILFAADDPVIGMLSDEGARKYILLSGVPDYRAATESLRVAADASAVEIAIAPVAGALRRFSIARGALTRVTASSPDLHAAVVRAPALRVSRWNEAGGPLVNGQKPALEPYETARAYALAPKHGTVLLGSEWALRRLDKHGATQWLVRTATAVRAVNVSGDERFAVVVLADGTIAWHRLSDGAVVLSLFIHADGESWLAWTPDGTYASSTYGDTFAGWQLNRGLDTAPDFFRAVQFERVLYRPEVIATALDSVAADVPATPADQPLLDFAPPRIRVSVLPSATRSLGMRRVRVSAESLGLPMRDVVAYVNDIPVTTFADRTLRAAEKTRFVREFEVPIAARDNDIRVEVFNGSSLGTAEKYVEATPRETPVGELYVLAVGANKFPHLDAGLELSYGARDAEEFAAAWRAMPPDRFSKLHVQTLDDDGRLPLRASILSALKSLSAARAEDTVVVFLASHGVSDAAGNYFFIPRDAARTDVDAIINGRTVAQDASLLGWQDVFDALRNVAGRRLLIVDTCQARQISGHFQDYSLVKRSASSRIAFVLAAQGNEESQEYEPGKHGLFTYALLEGLKGKESSVDVDIDRDGNVTVEEWFRVAAQLVNQLRDRRIGPQTPQLIAPASLRAMRLLGK
ncbi:MAG TPA: caspase family protein [Steroidobacteraceae bacterium]|nr:caspase family protein [Steroidobacteraceae bacterium]